jgi:hypothetical protein
MPPKIDISNLPDILRAMGNRQDVLQSWSVGDDVEWFNRFRA